MAIDICVRVGRRIRALREQRGWTQQILADHAQIAREHLCRIEDGRKEMGIRTLEKIASALGKSVEELLR
jgi:transcriptional regulator with XRE-family HTH domain